MRVLGYQRFFLGIPLANRPIVLLSAMLVLIGLQFVCFGLLAEILVRTYHESQDKKIYTVREVIRPAFDLNSPYNSAVGSTSSQRKVVGV